MKLLPYFLAFFTLLSCQTQKKLDCLKLNWQEKGKKGALSGATHHKALKNLVKNCRSKNTEVNESAFLLGYNKGLVEFCKTSVGLRVGQSGRIYHNICPKNVELYFLKGYIPGRIAHLTAQSQLLKEEYTKAIEHFSRKEQEYLLIKNEDPKRAQVQKDILEAYQEESNKLKKKFEKSKEEIIYLKRKQKEFKLN